MDKRIVRDRLDEITTNWSLLREAHNEGASQWQMARRALVLRYTHAIRRYLGAILQQDEMADDLAQDITLRMLEGDFQAADPQRGRFRDLLKVVISNMVRNHKKSEKLRTARKLPSDVQHHANDESAWVDAWRSTVLDMTWDAFRIESERKSSSAYTILRTRVDNQEASIEDLTAQVNGLQEKSLQTGTLRVQLHRARARFAELLVMEIGRSLSSNSAQSIEEELGALGLLGYINYS